MKTAFLTVAAVACVSTTTFADTVLQSSNFNAPAYTIGNLSNDATGTTAGQQGWYVYNTGTGGAADLQVVVDPRPGTVDRGQVLAVTAGNTATGNNVTRFGWTDSIHNASRPAGETLIVATYDFYMGGASSTSTNRYGNYMYDASGTKILAGVTMQNNTGQFYIVGNYNNAGTIGNYSFSTGTSGLLSRNTWYTFAITFDMATGRFQGGFSRDGGATFSMFYVDGAAAGIAVDEMDIIGSANSGTAAQGGTTGYYDNIVVTSTPAPGALALLGVAGLVGGRRRRS